jgi:hypothetical protein
MKNKLINLVYIAMVIILAIVVIYQDMTLRDYRSCIIPIEGGDIQKAELMDSIEQLTIDLKRYDVALEYLKDEDSATANKFETILYTLE